MRPALIHPVQAKNKAQIDLLYQETGSIWAKVVLQHGVRRVAVKTSEVADAGIVSRALHPLQQRLYDAIHALRVKHHTGSIKGFNHGNKCSSNVH
jgi:hypothetical protein